MLITYLFNPYNEMIKEWQDKLQIPHWVITTERIDPEQVMYAGEDYFIGISIDWDNLIEEVLDLSKRDKRKLKSLLKNC